MTRHDLIDTELPIEVLPDVARLAVISDTHMPRMAKHVPRRLRDALDRADLVLHAGDVVTGEGLRALEEYASVIGVAGNNDDEEVRARLPARRLLEWRGFRIGLAHGHEGRGRATPERALTTFRAHEVDAVVFGHSHIPLIEERDGVLLLNPGSPTDKRRQPQYSFGWLEAGDRLHARLEFYDSKT